jgi:TolA-binding protein
MKFIRHLITIVLILLTAVIAGFSTSALCQEEDLGKMSDDLKYETARYFFENRLYDKCLSEMHEYLEIYTNGAHRKEAYMTIADIHFKRYDYSKAAKTYISLYEEFSNSDEGLQAYLNASACYEKMGNEKKAREILKHIIDDHPDSRHASLAQTRLDVLDMTGKSGK